MVSNTVPLDPTAVAQEVAAAQAADADVNSMSVIDNTPAPHQQTQQDDMDVVQPAETGEFGALEVDVSLCPPHSLHDGHTRYLPDIVERQHGKAWSSSKN